MDFNGPTPQVSSTAPMAFGRRQHNLTVLADGSVLATGGNSSGASLVDLNAGVYPAELWSPATGQWRTLAAMQITRQYHSTALLLPDGRVLSAGGGICGTCDTVGYLAKNAEIFSPPYLFQADGTLAPRPSIDAAPASTTYGATMAIGTPDPASISKVALIRLGAVTHSNNMEQRYIPLSFTPGATTITATAPDNSNIAPPGIYMLFIIDANGVPSLARMVSVQGNSLPAVTLTQPADGATFSAPATVNLSATASDTDGTVTKIEFFNGTTKLGEDTTAPYSFTWSSVAGGELHAHRARHGRCRGHGHERGVQDHRRQQHQHAAGGQHHLPRRRRDLPLEADDQYHRHGDRLRRNRHEGRVPRWDDPCGPRQHRAVLLHMAERAGRKPRLDRTRDRQHGRRHDEQSGQDHRSPQAVSAPRPGGKPGLAGASFRECADAMVDS